MGQRSTKYALTAALVGVLAVGAGRPALADDAPLKLGEERAPTGEDQTIAAISKLQTDIMQAAKAAHLRGQHPKAHGCVKAVFTVPPDIPAELKVGIFQTPKRYQALIRFSNGRAFSDLEPDVHGMAIKLSGVAGAKALAGDASNEQDFIMIDNETMFAADAETMLGFMKAKVAALRDPSAIKTFAASGPNSQRSIELASKIGKTPASLLASSYWSTTPYKFGDRAVKYSARPDNHLREAIAERLSKRGAQTTFNFYVQVQTDAGTMPVEDATVAWTSPQIKVATISIAPQDFDTPARDRLCEQSSFSPWHALEVHRPLGGINRARKSAYEASSALRRGATP